MYLSIVVASIVYAIGAVVCCKVCQKNKVEEAESVSFSMFWPAVVLIAVMFVILWVPMFICCKICRRVFSAAEKNSCVDLEVDSEYYS